MHIVQVGRGLAQEGRVQELGNVGHGQHAADQGEQGKEGLARFHEGMVDQPFGREAAGRRHAHHRKPGNGEHGKGKGHLAANAAKVVKGFPVGGKHD